MENQKDYEISFLLKSEADRRIVEDALAAAGASLTFSGPLKELRLAYPIKKQHSAFFGFNQFKAAPEAINSVSGALRLKPEVFRLLIVTPPVQIKNKSEGIDRKPVVVETRSPEISNEALEQKLEEILK